MTLTYWVMAKLLLGKRMKEQGDKPPMSDGQGVIHTTDSKSTLIPAEGRRPTEFRNDGSNS